MHPWHLQSYYITFSRLWLFSTINLFCLEIYPNMCECDNISQLLLRNSLHVPATFPGNTNKYQHWSERLSAGCGGVLQLTSITLFAASNKAHTPNHWVPAILWSTRSKHNELSGQKPKFIDLEKCNVRDQRLIKLNFYERRTRFVFDFDLCSLWGRFSAADELRSQRAELLDSDWYWLQWH